MDVLFAAYTEAKNRNSILSMASTLRDFSRSVASTYSPFPIPRNAVDDIASDMLLWFLEHPYKILESDYPSPILLINSLHVIIFNVMTDQLARIYQPDVRDFSEFYTSYHAEELCENNDEAEWTRGWIESNIRFRGALRCAVLDALESGTVVVEIGPRRFVRDYLSVMARIANYNYKRTEEL
jgi:hypothetical protein